MSYGHNFLATKVGIAERTPNSLAAQLAVHNTEFYPPTAQGKSFHSGLESSSQAT